jgi:hypothetical protein
VDDIIFYKDMIYLVPESTLKEKIMRATHDTPLAGHPGYFKTYRQIRERFSWKGLKDDVLRHVRECMTCQQNKSEHTHPAGLLQPLPIPEHKMGECVDGFHHRSTEGAWQGLHLCSG